MEVGRIIIKCEERRIIIQIIIVAITFVIGEEIEVDRGQGKGKEKQRDGRKWRGEGQE